MDTVTLGAILDILKSSPNLQHATDKVEALLAKSIRDDEADMDSWQYMKAGE